MLNLLQERGLKGRPTLSECRRLKKKYEKKQELAELNTSNIIGSSGDFTVLKLKASFYLLLNEFLFFFL